MPDADLATTPSARRWPRELLVVLAMTPPLLALVFEPGGMRHQLITQVRSVLANWIYAMSLGAGIQIITDQLTGRWPGVLEGRRGAVTHLAFVHALVIVLTMVLAVPLAWTCPGLHGRISTLWVWGAVLSTVCVFAGPTVASVADHP